MKNSLMMAAVAAAATVNLAASVLEVTPERWPTTPYEAMERIHGDRKAGGYEGFTVKIAEGTYAIDKPIVFEPVDSSRSDQPIVFEGVPGKTVISGGLRITGWTEDGDGVWSAPLPQERGKERAFFEMMWVNGRRAQRARYPKKGFLTPSRTERRSDAVAAVEFDDDGAKRILAATAKEDLPFVQVVNHQIWGVGRIIPDAIEAKSGAFLAKPPIGRWPSWRSWGHWSNMYLENFRAAFTDPGEWFYDAAAGRVRYRPLPGEKVPELEIMIARPGFSQFVAIRGEPAKGKYVRNVVFRNLIFEYCDTPQSSRIVRPAWADMEQCNDLSRADRGPGPSRLEPGQAAVWDSATAAIDMKGARHVRFENCVVRHTGGYAVKIEDGCCDVRIENNEFRDLGSGGVLVGEWREHQYHPDASLDTGRKIVLPDRPESVHEIHVRNNVITDGGWFNAEGVGVIFTHVSDSCISHNDISELNYSGINCGWTWGYRGSVSQRNTIEFNRIRNVGRGQLNDMGGVYLLGTSYGTRVANNVIENVCSAEGTTGWGLYCDAGTEGATMEMNLVVNKEDTGFQQNYGTENTIRNNIFIVGGKKGALTCGNYAVAGVRCSYNFVNNIVYALNDAPQVGLRGDMPAGVWANNVWWSPDGCDSFAQESWKAWRDSGREQNSVWADPLFADFAKGDYRLKPDSPALARGFRPLDVSKAGVEGK